MRRTIMFLLAVILVAATTAIAQIPHTISYQGILTDGTGAVVSDGTYRLTLKLYHVDMNGTASWTESQDITTVDGLFNVILGAKTPMKLLFDRQLWLGITVGTEAELAPRIKLTASAYSIRAQRADTANAAIHALQADKADDAQTVGGYAVSPTPAANKLLVLDASGKFPTSAIASVPAVVQDGSLTGVKIATGEVVKSINTLHDDVELAAGSNVSIVSIGNTLTISATPGGGGGDITAVNTVPASGLMGGAQAGDVSLSIADGGVTTAKLADGAVTSTKLANNAITSSKLADLSVTNTKIDNQSVAVTKLSSSGSSEGQVITNFLGNATWRDPTGLTLPFYGAIINSGPVFHVLNTATGTSQDHAIQGVSLSGSGIQGKSTMSFGVAGESITTYGIAGISTSSSGHAGVMGENVKGDGVLGRSNSATFSAVHGYNQSGNAIRGESDADNKSGVYGVNSHITGFGVYGRNLTKNTAGYLGGINGASGSFGNDYVGHLGVSIGGVTAGVFGSHGPSNNYSALGTSTHACYVNGSLYQTAGVFEVHPTSTVWTTNKPATVKLDNGSKVKLFAEEATEVLFCDYGEGQLVNGRLHIDLDPKFLQTVTINAQHPLKVFVQLEDDCNGVFITNKSSVGFDVAELQQGTSNARFSYRVVCKRKYYEDERLATESEDVAFNTNMLTVAWPEVIEKRNAMNEQLHLAKETDSQVSAHRKNEHTTASEHTR